MNTTPLEEARSPTTERGRLVARLAVILGAPIALALLAVVHPLSVSQDLVGRTDLWLGIHVAQLGLLVLLGFAMWLLLEGTSGTSARIARGSILPWAVFFAAFDAIAGIAIGLLVMDAEAAPPADRSAISGSVQAVAASELVDRIGLAAGLFAVGVFVVGGLALLRAGAPWWATLMIATGGLAWTFIHPLFGAVGMVAFALGAARIERWRDRGD